MNHLGQSVGHKRSMNGVNNHRKSLRISKENKRLLDELKDEERENRINLAGQIVEFYAKEKHPTLYQKFKNGELKLQMKDK